MEKNLFENNYLAQKNSMRFFHGKRIIFLKKTIRSPWKRKSNREGLAAAALVFNVGIVEFEAFV